MNLMIEKEPLQREPVMMALRQTANYVASVQLDCGAIPWFTGGKLDPWDHIEGAMGLSVMGLDEHAERAYHWLLRAQHEDGGWHAHYFSDADTLKQTHFIAYVAVGVWHHYLISGSRAFLRDMFPCVKRAIDCVLRFQSDEGDIAWAYDLSGRAEADALLTGCSSILRSLTCAVNIADALAEPTEIWTHAATKLRECIRFRPYRFDRTWESKTRFAMDWYYPILSGALTKNESRRRLQGRWNEFVEHRLGCRCVCDEPWVTTAESCELVIALVAAGKGDEARVLFNDVQQWRDQSDGAYWTGYVFPDKAIWPEEKTTWSAAAVILAADAIFGISPAHSLFSVDLP